MAKKAKPRNSCPPECGAECCTYFALEIDEPEDEEDFDNIRWYLLHEKVAVYLAEGCWHLLILNPCTALDALGRCARYQDRPKLCRAYGGESCEFHDHIEFDAFFGTPEAFDEYLMKQGLMKRKSDSSRHRSSK